MAGPEGATRPSAQSRASRGSARKAEARCAARGSGGTEVWEGTPRYLEPGAELGCGRRKRLPRSQSNCRRERLSPSPVEAAALAAERTSKWASRKASASHSSTKGGSSGERQEQAGEEEEERARWQLSLRWPR